MSTRFRRKRGEDGDEGSETPGSSAQDPSQAAQHGEGLEPDGAPESNEELVRQRDEYLGMWQRANADYQNLRRRTLQDVEQAARRAKEGLLHELLRVLDYLEMALASECQGQEAKNLLLGVRMTRDELVAVLEREGVRPIPEQGPFDPELHQAIATVETDEAEPGAVLATVRRGYRLADHTLRHAQVHVATLPGEGLRAQGPESSSAPDERPE